MEQVIALVGLLLAFTDVRPLTPYQTCTTKWGLDVRHVRTVDKRRIYAAAGVPWGTKGYIVDHRVPRELAGADTLVNYQLQTASEAHRKDVLENFLHRAVCSSTIPLVTAQQMMREWK